MQIIKWLFLSLFFFTFSVVHASTHDIPKRHVINEIPTSGIVINTPGTYVFEHDLNWIPSGDGQAILIVSNDVTLDLQHHTLSSEITQFNTTGIQATSVTNLIIKNGVVAHMAYRGIHCSGCEDILIKHMTVDGLNLDNIIDYTVPVGIYVDTSINVLIDKCTVKNIDVTTGSSAAIQLSETISSIVSNCHVKNMINRDGACTGIGHALCDTATVKLCTLDHLESQFNGNQNTEGHTTIGLVPVGSTNLLIEDCKISNITGCCDDAHGMSIFECAFAIVKRCKVENVLDGVGATHTGAKSTGIEIYASGVQVIDCFVKNILAINPQDKQATGFSCAQCLGVMFIKCRAENVSVVDENGNQSPSLGYGTGFGWAPDPRPAFLLPAVDTLYLYCTAKKCQVGFDSWYHIDSLWDHIYSDCNQIPILDQNQPQRTLSCDGCSECGCTFSGCYPEPISIPIDNIAANNVFLHVKVKNCH